MADNYKKSCFEFLKIDPSEMFEKPESWGKSTRYYMTLLEEKKGQDLFFSWNWAGFFLFPYWMLYRKMVLYGSFSFLLVWMGWPLGHILGGLIANPLYLHFVKRKVTLGKTQTSSTSWLYPMMGFLIMILLGLWLGLMIFSFSHAHGIYLLRNQ